MESTKHKYHSFNGVRLRTNHSIGVAGSFSTKDDDGPMFTNPLEHIQNKLIGHLSKDTFKNYFLPSPISAMGTQMTGEWRLGREMQKAGPVFIYFNEEEESTLARSTWFPNNFIHRTYIVAKSTIYECTVLLCFVQDTPPSTGPSTGIAIKNIKTSENKPKKLAKKATASKAKGEDVVRDEDEEEKVLVKQEEGSLDEWIRQEEEDLDNLDDLTPAEYTKLFDIVEGAEASVKQEESASSRTTTNKSAGKLASGWQPKVRNAIKGIKVEKVEKGFTKPRQQIIDELYAAAPPAGEIPELFTTDVRIGDVFNEALSKNLSTILTPAPEVETPSNITAPGSEIPDSVTNPPANATLGSNVNKKVVGAESTSHKRTISKVDSSANNDSSKLSDITTNRQTRSKAVGKGESLLSLEQMEKGKGKKW